MNSYTTKIIAINPQTNELCEWAGPLVPGISFADATDYCNRNGLGYCEVTGIHMGYVPVGENGLPDFKNKIDNYTYKLN